MADFDTPEIVSAELDPSDGGSVGKPYSLKTGMDFTKEMKGHPPTPVTAPSFGGGSGGGRPTTGLVWPH